MEKVYVEVNANFMKDGRIFPRALMWEDEQIPIDRVLHIDPLASLKEGGSGLRYTCMSAGKRHYLYLEPGYRWFVEA